MPQRVVAFGLVAIVAGCDAAARPVLMSELPRYEGPLRVAWSGGGGGERVLAGELSFDRVSGSIVFARHVDGRRHELRRVGDGPLRALDDGVPVETTLADEGDLALLLLVLGSEPPDGEIRTTADGYTFEQGDQRLAVSFARPGSQAAPAESR